MTTTQLTDWLLAPGLAPDPADSLAPLYTGAAADELHLPHCAACGLALELEQRVCDGCGGAEVIWRAVAPAGTVHSVTVVHRREPGLVLAEEPYPVADIELASGHRLVLAPVFPGTAPPAIGDPVAIGFRRLGEVAVPGFTTAPAAHDPYPEEAS
ncbi:Zn-ribbon domain-containing OB-fold protein [Pseudonocardia sp. KRD291]|uniref:Zn-ribbon domain-containing OB-fold protein n=1 Tax=Pseudonocardia sp. KRD291 TaxID=2792007 RepID=UPI001C49CDEA|nr:OB-fold domain-containing protein [Pseudonocardia sp. KRD291]MBW0103999.1 OB-fold domain-containing protein [Pseudonocardia sp. KRD291]